MVIFSKYFPGGLEVSSLRKLTRVVKGEDAMSGLFLALCRKAVFMYWSMTRQ